MLPPSPSSRSLTVFMELWQRERIYSARQREDEECARWSCRLEDIISKGQQKGLVHFRECDEMLRTTFFKGLRLSLKYIYGSYMISVIHLIRWELQWGRLKWKISHHIRDQLPWNLQHVRSSQMTDSFTWGPDPTDNSYLIQKLEDR